MTESTSTIELSADVQAEIERQVQERIGDLQSSFTQQIDAALQNASLARHEGPDKQKTRRASIICFSGDMDKLLAAFVVANGAAALGIETSMYFAFWGLTALKQERRFKGKSLLSRMLTFMLPAGAQHVGCSKMNMFGLGPRLFRYRMKKKNVSDLPTLIQTAVEQGVRLIGCQMSMDVMGVTPEELFDSVQIGGVSTYLLDAQKADITLFV